MEYLFNRTRAFHFLSKCLKMLFEKVLLSLSCGIQEKTRQFSGKYCYSNKNSKQRNIRKVILTKVCLRNGLIIILISHAQLAARRPFMSGPRQIIKNLCFKNYLMCVKSI